MAGQWLQEIRDRDPRELTIFPTPRLARSRWGPIFRQAVATFNTLSDVHRLVVKFKESATPPDSEGFKDGGADVQIDFSGGNATYRFRGEEHTTIRPVSGTGILGYTETLRLGGSMLKCFVFVPMFPLANDDREVGDGVKLSIVVHELVHVAGCLDNNEHSPETNPDVFCGTPVSTPQFLPGKTADLDRIGLKPGQQTPTRFIPGVATPPIKLSARTAGLIQQAWR